jgi:hypothetical protein
MNKVSRNQKAVILTVILRPFAANHLAESVDQGLSFPISASIHSRCSLQHVIGANSDI